MCFVSVFCLFPFFCFLSGSFLFKPFFFVNIFQFLCLVSNLLSFSFFHLFSVLFLFVYVFCLCFVFAFFLIFLSFFNSLCISFRCNLFPCWKSFKSLKVKKIEFGKTYVFSSLFHCRYYFHVPIIFIYHFLSEVGEVEVEARATHLPEKRSQGYHKNAALEDQGRERLGAHAQNTIPNRICHCRLEQVKRIQYVQWGIQKKGHLQIGKSRMIWRWRSFYAIQGPSCAKYWPERLSYGTCGTCLRPPKEQKRKTKEFEVLSIPHDIVKKNFSRGAKHGPSQEQYDHFKANESTRRWSRCEDWKKWKKKNRFSTSRKQTSVSEKTSGESNSGYP